MHTTTRFNTFVPAYVTEDHQARLREAIRQERLFISHHTKRIDDMEKALNEAIVFSKKLRAERKR